MPEHYAELLIDGKAEFKNFAEDDEERFVEKVDDVKNPILVFSDKWEIRYNDDWDGVYDCFALDPSRFSILFPEQPPRNLVCNVCGCSEFTGSVRMIEVSRVKEVINKFYKNDERDGDYRSRKIASALGISLSEEGGK